MDGFFSYICNACNVESFARSSTLVGAPLCTLFVSGALLDAFLSITISSVQRGTCAIDFAVVYRNITFSAGRFSDFSLKYNWQQPNELLTCPSFFFEFCEGRIQCVHQVLKLSVRNERRVTPVMLFWLLGPSHETSCHLSDLHLWYQFSVGFSPPKSNL